MFANSREEDIRQLRLRLEQDFVPPTFFDSLLPPLPSGLSSLSEHFLPVSRVMAALLITFTGKAKVEVRAFISWMESWYSIQGAEYKCNTPESH